MTGDHTHLREWLTLVVYLPGAIGGTLGFLVAGGASGVDSPGALLAGLYYAAIGAAYLVVPCVIIGVVVAVVVALLGAAASLVPGRRR